MSPFILGVNLPVLSETVTALGLTFKAKKVGKVVTIMFYGIVASNVSVTDYNDVGFTIGVSSPFGRLCFNMAHGMLTTRNHNSICLHGIKTGDVFEAGGVDGDTNYVTFITED